jgi:uridine kinase
MNEKEIIEYNSDQQVTIQSLIPESKKYKYICARIDGRLRELSYVVKKPCKIELFGVFNDVEAMQIYKNTLMFVVAMALHNLYPEEKMLFSNDVSRSIFIRPKNIDDKFSTSKIFKLNQEIKRITSEDIKIERREIKKEEAIKEYTKFNMLDKVEVLKYRDDEYIHQYVCDGYIDYMYGYIAPSTKYVSYFNIVARNPGFLVQYPRVEENGRIPPFIPETVYEKTLEDARSLASKLNVGTIADINNFIEKYGDNDLIQTSETIITNQLAEVGEMIINSPSKIKLICVAGPSSSSKTTFSNRLRLELMSRGLFPIRISLDDYYIERDKLPVEEDGSVDFETIRALDIQLFNENMFDLIEGKEVTLPYFNFQTGKSEKGRTLKLGDNQPIIVEGIHALSEEMTASIPSENKFKIYIAPQAQINIDDHSPISLTDLRMLRRIVRDYQFRNSGVEYTLNMWPKVRNGEFNWIYNTQQEADYVFNSFMFYELCVMKNHAYPLLNKVGKDSPYYAITRRLILFLKYFKTIDESTIPSNSLIREFIGGSCFKDV